ncbi:MAG: hypothetical protein LBG80_19250, partial [Bacteroidales bacterium]|nr:hypothetical protein [Bacteroidales bacterium]
FNEVIRLFLCDIPLLLRLFCWENKVEIRFLFSMFEHPTLRDFLTTTTEINAGIACSDRANEVEPRPNESSQ